MIGAYILTDRMTGKFYVGSSSDIHKRIARHYSDLRCRRHHCQPLIDIWVDDDRFHITMIPTESRDIAFDLEQDLIDQHKGSVNLLNVSCGARGGDTLTRNPKRKQVLENLKKALLKRYQAMTPEERKEKFGKTGKANWMWGRTHTAEAKAKISAANLGITHRSGFTLSEEHRAKISENAKTRVGELNSFFGKTHSQETKDLIAKKQRERGYRPPNVRKISIGNKIYETLTEASRDLNVSPALIVYRLKSNLERYCDYVYLT